MDGFQELLVMFKSPGRIHTSRHTIFCKKHTVRINSNLTPNNKTLFTLGWPPYCSKEAIEDLFSRAGHVNSVYLCMNPGQVEKSEDMREYCGFHVAYVVFSTESEAMSALNLCLTSEPIPCHTSCVGLSKWSREYMLGHPSVTSLEAAVEEGVALYDRRREEAIQKQKKAGEPDEDGWITVTRKTPKIITDEQSKRHRKKKQDISLSVYPWQQRESQREQVAQLRRKFEEDKERVAILKAKRRFKPY